MKSSLRPAAVLVALLALIAFILTSCPSNRDGAPGQLASAKEEAESACRSGLLALDQWTGGRSSAQLVSVQLGDARDQVVKAYKGIATQQYVAETSRYKTTRLLNDGFSVKGCRRAG